VAHIDGARAGGEGNTRKDERGEAGWILYLSEQQYQPEDEQREARVKNDLMPWGSISASNELGATDGPGRGIWPHGPNRMAAPRSEKVMEPNSRLCRVGGGCI
jgi:uncharacterized protein with LGFP repeats